MRVRTAIIIRIVVFELPSILMTLTTSRVLMMELEGPHFLQPLLLNFGHQPATWRVETEAAEPPELTIPIHE